MCLGNIVSVAAAATMVLITGTGFAAAGEPPKLGGQFERYPEYHLYAYEIFEELNVRSIDVNREFCGFLYFDAAGELQATKPAKGGTHSCTPTIPEGRARIFASYHTHAAFAPGSLNEYPSDIDIRGDFGNGHSGYVATPGGRLWFVDNEKQVARQLCGYRCLPYDPAYREDPRARPKTNVSPENIDQIIANKSDYEN